ncbi:MAG TPA: PIN domain-containing protein [Acidimicrobiales bacterium]|nr:PIN domain-containing protein [Acidimicrobiales bacterium]
MLDTTFLIDTERSQFNLDDVIADEDDVAIAAITVAEVQVGAELATGRTRRRRMELLDEVVASIPILDYDLAVARSQAQLLVIVRRQGRPRGAHDLIIAATALSSGRSLVTADEKAFVDLGVVTISYR